MEQENYIVYVRTDEQSRILEANSSAFLADTTGWTAIDEGWATSTTTPKATISTAAFTPTTAFRGTSSQTARRRCAQPRKSRRTGRRYLHRSRTSPRSCAWW